MDPPPREQATPAPAATARQSPRPGDTTLRWAIEEPTAIVPVDATSPEDLVVVDALFDSLTAWSDTLEVRPAVALRWEARRRGRVWRFQLRPSATFHDGTPVTARHFRRTWSSMARAGAAHHHLRDVAGYAAVRSGRAQHLRGVVAVDATTLDVRLTRPVADLPAVVGHPSLAPMRDQAGAADMPVGNGPFRMAEPWARGRFVRLTRAPGGSRVAGVGTPLDEVIFRFQDEATAYIAFGQERVDVAPVPIGALAEAAHTPAPRVTYRGPGVLRGPLPTTHFLWFNTGRPPLDRPAVRRAVSLAVDRARLASDVFENNASPAAGVAPAVLPGARATSCRSCRHRPDAARRLFAAAGVQRLALWVSEGGDHERVAERVRADLLAAGVQVHVRRVPFDEFLDALRRGRPGLFRFGWTLDYPTLESALRPLFHSSQIGPAGVNFGRYSSPRADRLLDRAAAMLNPRRRRLLLQAAEDQILVDQAIVPLVRLHRRTIVADRVRMLTYGPFGTADLSAVRVVRRTDPG